MRPIQWVMIIGATNILYLWMFLHLDLETHPVTSSIVIGIHVVACVGPFWMLYDWFVRRNKRTWKAWMWLFFVPWGFLWYWFEQYRPTRMVKE